MNVYIITNLINGKKYIGMDTHNNPKYLGSGLAIMKAVKKYGKENFKKEIIEECKTIENLEKRETYWIEHFNAIKDKNYYNLADVRKRGKNPFENKTKEELEEITNKIISNRDNKSIGEKNREHRLGKSRSLESKLKQSESMKGQKHPVTSQKLKGRVSPSKGKTWTQKKKI